MARFEDYVSQEMIDQLRKKQEDEDNAKLASNNVPGRSFLERIKDAVNTLTTPAEYDELDTSGYLPNQQMAGQGLAKTAGAIGQLMPENKPHYWKNPITGDVVEAPQIDPTAIGGMKILRGASTLPNISKMGTLGDVISPKTKDALQSITNKAGAQKLAQEIKQGRSLSAQEIDAINNDPELLQEFTKKMESNSPDFTIFNDPKNIPGDDFIMKREGKFTPNNPAQTTDIIPQTKNTQVTNLPILAEYKNVPNSSSIFSNGKLAAGAGIGAGAIAGQMLGAGGNNNPPIDSQFKSGAGPFSDPKKYGQYLDSQNKQPPETSNEEISTETPSTTESSSPETKELQDQLNLDAEQQQSFVDALKKAQEQSKEEKAQARLMMAANTLLSGALGTSYKVKAPELSNKYWEDVVKDSDQSIKDLLQIKEAEKEDPNSPISKRMREIMSPMLQKIGINLPEQMSYSEIQRNFPQFTKMYDAQLMSEQRQQQKEETQNTKKETEQKNKQDRFLSSASGKFAKDKTNDAYLIMKEALDRVDDYLKNPNPISAQSMAYIFAKINDPQSAVREGELKLFGQAGSLFDRYSQFIRSAISGEISKEKAQDFKDFIGSKISTYENHLKTNISPYVKQGERLGLTQQEVVENIAGPEYYKNLFEQQGKKMPKEQKIKNFGEEFNYNGMTLKVGHVYNLKGVPHRIMCKDPNDPACAIPVSEENK